MDNTLSVCMIVKNEAQNIARCLESIKDFADELVVVDTGSVDDTKTIAASHGAKVFDFEWVDDFSKARNHSISMAAGDWILILDGDDEFERKDGPKLLELIRREDAADIYIFNTVCYIGDKVGNDKIMNVNLRLFRNRPDFKYQGRIHESIITTDPAVKMKTCDITIYHYGYLNEIVKDQKKRERNMRILETQLEEAPGNPYFLFCMGNEYFALNDYAKAQEYFLSSYSKCNVQDVYVPKLIIRIIMAYQAMSMLKEALSYCEIALQHYPQYTDIEFIRGGIYHRTGNVIKAINSFQRCLELGEPPAMLNFVIGVGTYRPYHALASIFHQLNEYDEALRFYNQALLVKNDYHDSVYGIGSVLAKIYREDEQIKQHLMQYFPPNSGECDAMMADILFIEKKYRLSLEFLDRALAQNIKVQELLFVKAKCLYNLRLYEEAAAEFEKIDKDNKFYLNARTMLLLSCFMRGCFEKTEMLLKEIGELDQFGKVYKMFCSLSKILQGQEKEILSEDRLESGEYLVLIMDTLDAILSTAEFEIFEKALELFNCIENDEVLLALAKLYNKYGYIEQSVKEIKRSMRIFDKLDEETAYILYRSFSIIKSGMSEQEQDKQEEPQV